MVCAVVATSQLECDGGQPPSREGLSLLEFGNQRGSGFAGPTEQIMLQYYLGAPFDVWSLRGAYLVSDANTNVAGDATFNVRAPVTTTTPFDLTADALHAGTDSFVQYRSVDTYWRANPDLHFDVYRQHENVLFARDPNEVFGAMASLRSPPVNSPPTISTILRGEFTANTWPDSATLIYPPRAGWKTTPAIPGPTATRAYYSTLDFWQSGATPSGPAAAPSGTGSVKATMVVDHGLCSQLTPYSSIFSSIPIQFMSAIEKRLADGTDRNETITLMDSNVVSFLRLPDERDSQPQGGFFFGFDAAFSNIKSLPIVGDVRAFAQYWNPYQFVLLDGRLTVDPLRDFSSTGVIINYTDALNDAVAADFEEQLDGALLQSMTTPLHPTDAPSTLAETVWHTADLLQRWPGDPGVGCPNDPERIHVVSDPTTQAGTCSTLFFQMRQNLQTALQSGHFGNFVGVPTTAFGQLWNDTALKSSDGQFYDNFRCAPITDGGAKQCQYIARAERINVLPDGVELVLVDDDKHFANPTMVPWLIAGDDKTLVGGKPILRQMCDPPRQAINVNGPTFSLGRRPFTHTAVDSKTFSATNCVWAGFDPLRYNCDVVVQ